MATPTVGVIGLGFGRAHIPAFQANGCEVVAVCQRDETAARRIADAHGVKGVFTHWEDMLERARPAIVAIGRPFHIAARWLGARWAAESAGATWRMDRAQAGHGALGDMGVHVVDLVRWSFGEFTRVAATMGIPYPARSAPGVGRPPDAEDWCVLLGELDNGAHVSFTASRAAHGVNEHTLEAYGSAGAVQYRLGRDAPRWWAGELRLSRGGAFEVVPPRAPVPSIDSTEAFEQIGRGTIAPPVADRKSTRL